MSKKTILHIAPFIWTMGYQRGIFGVQSYTLFEKFGYDEFFIAPDINLFSTNVKINNEMLKKAKLNGIVFEFSKMVGASKLIDNIGKFSFLNKFAYFFLYMIICFFISLKALSRLRNVVCIYAHAWVCVPPAFLLSRLFGIPCISRVYGIHNYKIGLFGNAIRSLSKSDLLIFKIPCDAYVITNDGTMGKSVAMRMGVPEDKILFELDGVPEDFFVGIHNWHNGNLDNPCFRSALPSERRIILYVGRLIEWKRADRLIYVLHSAHRKNPETNMCLVIAGDGPLLGSLKNLVADLNLEDKVVFHGSVERNRLKELFASCDIYLTLQDLTNLSNSVLEAMAQGRCVVAGDVGGTRDVIEDKKTGFLVPLHNSEETSSIIVDLLSNEGLRCLIGEKAKLYAMKHFLVWSDRAKYELDWITEKFLF
jgi:glycosyltransferase involved in cell wall biosynthesis